MQSSNKRSRNIDSDKCFEYLQWASFALENALVNVFTRICNVFVQKEQKVFDKIVMLDGKFLSQ